MNHRIIARLDIKGPNLVKGIHLEGLRVLGKPESAARYYYETGADELIYADVVASLYGRNSLNDIISRTAREISIPLTVGGGLRTVADIRDALRAGADKVFLNTAAIKNPEIIRKSSRVFGSSTIVVSIEVIKSPDGRHLAYTDNGREYTGQEALAWARLAEEMGAGEIMLTSVDRDGTGLGFDLDITRQLAEAVSIPVIAHGGAGRADHVRQVIAESNASAVAVASIIHYDYIRQVKETGEFKEEGNLEFMKSGRAFSKIFPAGCAEIKHCLQKAGIPCRPGKPPVDKGETS